MSEKGDGFEGWLTQETVLPDGTVRTEVLACSALGAELYRRRQEARRLLTLSRSSLYKLHVLTGICPNDHRLFDVYRIGGVLVWEGQRKSRSGQKWPDGKFGKLGKRSHRVMADILDSDPTHILFAQLIGSCDCGETNTGASPEWVLAQIGRDDLPSHRRVVVPTKAKGVR